MNGENPVLMSDVGQLKDAHALQYNVVHVNGQRSVYLPVMKQGGDSNTIAVVDGVRKTVKHLFDVPAAMKTEVVFDQSRFVRTAIETLLHEGGIGLFLTCVMILVFLGSLRATVAVFFSIPLSVCATFFVLQTGRISINSMVLGGLALALSRLIDNSVVVLENIYRHLEMGEPPARGRGNRREGGRAAGARLDANDRGGVLSRDAAGRSEQVSVLGDGRGGGGVAVRVVLCGDDGGAVVLRALPDEEPRRIPAGLGRSVQCGVQHRIPADAGRLRSAGAAPVAGTSDGAGVILLSLRSEPAAVQPARVWRSFPQTDAGQFVINFKAPSGTKLTVTETGGRKSWRRS